MVVGGDLQPVVDAAHEDVGRDDIGDGTVLERDVQQADIVDVEVVAADVPLVAEVGEPRDRMRPRGDGLGPDRLAVVRHAFLALEVKRRCQRMAPLTDHYPAA